MILSHALRAVKKGGDLEYIASSTSQSTNSALTSRTISVPAGAQSGDLLVVVASRGSTSGSYTALSGWTERIDSTGLLVSTLDTPYDGTTANYTFSFTASSASFAMLCFRYAGWDAISGVISSAAISPTANPVTISTNNSFQLGVVISTAATQSFSYPSGFTPIAWPGNSGPSLFVILNDNLQPSGATSSITFTRTSGSSSANRAIQFSIKPV